MSENHSTPSNELRGVARITLHEGKREEFKRLATQVVELARAKDTGTLQYDIYFSDDESECIFLERFADSAALIEHNANLGELLQKMLATGSVSAELFGEPSDALRAMLAGSPIRFFKPFLSL